MKQRNALNFQNSNRFSVLIYDCNIFSCPYFRNEIGGEEETVISLTRETGKYWGLSEEGADRVRIPCHTPRYIDIISVMQEIIVLIIH